jgi:peroxiredoxin Q/BCP
VLGISFDTPASNAIFAKRYQFPFALLSDEDRTVCMAYGACNSKEAPVAKRITYLIDAHGKVEKTWARLKPAEHAGAVLAYLS